MQSRILGLFIHQTFPAHTKWTYVLVNRRSKYSLRDMDIVRNQYRCETSSSQNLQLEYSIKDSQVHSCVVLWARCGCAPFRRRGCTSLPIILHFSGQVGISCQNVRILETGPLSTTLFKFRVPAGRPAWQSPCLACDLVSNEMRPPLTVESAAEQSRAERRRGRKSYCHSRTIAAPLSTLSHSQSQYVQYT